MDQNEVAIRLFMFASALLLAIEAAKCEGRIRIGFGIGAVAFIIVGVFWTVVAAVFPTATREVAKVALSPSSWFMLALVIFLVFRERRLGAIGMSAADGSAALSASNAKVSDDLAKVRQEVARLTVAVGDLRGDLTTVSTTAESAQNAIADASDHASRIEAKADAARSEVRELGDRVGGLVQTTDNLLQSRFAQKTDIALRRLGGEIDRLDGLLYFSEGKGIGSTNWEVWQNNELRWRAAVQNWAIHSNSFAGRDVMPLIIATPQNDFYGTWSFNDSDLPDANTVHRYKAFCIMRRNFQTVKEEVEGVVWRAAFG